MFFSYIFKNQISEQMILSAKTKIVVLHMKELIYTGIFILLSIVLILLLISMFTPEKSEKQQPPKTTQEAQLSAPLISDIPARFKIQIPLLRTAEADMRSNMADRRILP